MERAWAKLPTGEGTGALPGVIGREECRGMGATDRHDDPAQADHARTLGWASGLALLPVPWIAAGILATTVTMVGPDGWDAESTFPWFLLAAFAAALGWIAYGSTRISGFRRGAVPGAAIALATMAGIYVLARFVGT
jgi:hypothetical protein